MKRTLWKYLSTVAFLCLYSYVLPRGFITIDPCACTPRHDYTIGLMLLVLFPFALGVLIYFLFVYENAFSIKSLLKSVTLSAVWLIFVLVFIVQTSSLLIVSDILSHPIPYLVEFGCYNDLEVTDLFISLLFAVNAILVGLVIYLMVKQKFFKIISQ